MQHIFGIVSKFEQVFSRYFTKQRPCGVYVVDISCESHKICKDSIFICSVYINIADVTGISGTSDVIGSSGVPVLGACGCAAHCCTPTSSKWC